MVLLFFSSENQNNIYNGLLIDMQCYNANTSTLTHATTLFVYLSFESN